MPEFVPANTLEIALRNLLRDKNTPYWSFYTPLAAATLWIITKHYPELDGSDEVAPAGQNPAVCILKNTTGTGPDAVGIYTSPDRVEAAFEFWKLSRAEMTTISAPGFRLLRFLNELDAQLVMNAGLPECQFILDPDMVNILLSRPEPTLDQDVEPASRVTFHPAVNPERHLGPLRDFLARQPTVRAAWVFGQDAPATPLPAGHRAYELFLIMADPDDDSLLEQVEVMAKALTPVEMEWSAGVGMADDRSLRNLIKEKRPFYTAPGFLKPAAPRLKLRRPGG